MSTATPTITTTITLSPSVDQLFTALVQAQSHMGIASKDSKNPHFRSKYSSVESVLDAVLPRSWGSSPWIGMTIVCVSDAARPPEQSATIAAQGYRFRVPYGTLLCVSDKPLHGELKLPGAASLCSTRCCPRSTRPASR